MARFYYKKDSTLSKKHSPFCYSIHLEIPLEMLWVQILKIFEKLKQIAKFKISFLDLVSPTFNNSEIRQTPSLFTVR